MGDLAKAPVKQPEMTIAVGALPQPRTSARSSACGVGQK